MSRSAIKLAALGGLSWCVVWSGCQKSEEFHPTARDTSRPTATSNGAAANPLEESGETIAAAPVVLSRDVTPLPTWSDDRNALIASDTPAALPFPDAIPAAFPSDAVTESTAPAAMPASGVIGETSSEPVKLVRAIEREESVTGTPSPLQPLGTQPAELQRIQSLDLFNGHDLTGWTVQEGLDDAWIVEEGAIVCRRAGGGWLRTHAVYSDFDLRFEYRLDAGANTGVGLRFPSEGSPTLTGIEVQLIDDAAQKYAELRPDQKSGSLYYQFAPTAVASRPAGEWNECQIVARGSRVQVTINGQLVNDAQLDGVDALGKPHPLGSRPPLGHIGFQSSGQRAAFRNIVFNDLTTETASGLRYVDLHPGTGPIAKSDSTVVVDFVARFDDGTKFDSSEDRGQPVTVALDDVISGWKEGISGMQVGGRRKLIVPASLGYGQQGVPGLVAPDAILIFEVDLRSVAD